MPNPFQKLRESLRRKRADHADARPFAQAVGAIAVVVLLVVVLVWLPRFQVSRTHGIPAEKRFDNEDAARKTLAQILGGTIVMLGLYFSAKTYGLSRESQITDRFTKAIEQLGKTDGTVPNIEVRLGAIYALERIANDSRRDHWTIMEVLTAYVRQNAPLQGLQEKPRTDIQAILTVLGRRRTGPERENEEQRLDLSNSHLAGANLSGAKLRAVLLYKANLQGAVLNKAALQGASLRNADVKYSSLILAELQGANLDNADLSHANLSAANLQGVVMIAKIKEVEMRTSLMQDSDLTFADLRGAKLLGCMQKADFTFADLRDVDFRSSILEEAIFFGAKIAGADLRKVVGITPNQMKAAENWQSAHYSPAFRAELGLSPERPEDDPPTR